MRAVPSKFRLCEVVSKPVLGTSGSALTGINILSGNLCDCISNLIPDVVHLFSGKAFQQLGANRVFGVGAEGQEEFFGLTVGRAFPRLGGLLPKKHCSKRPCLQTVRIRLIEPCTRPTDGS